jgi:tetratricopeptide (TPR) repeat protein
MLRLRYVCALVMLAASSAVASSRLTFDRTIPAPRSLGRVEDLLITYAIGDNDRIATFIDVFIDQTNREGTLRVIDPTTVERSTERSHRWRNPPKYAEQRYRADAYLRIEAFSCQTTDRSGLGGAYDVDGNRVHRTQRWVDAVCVAHIDALATDHKRKLAEFNVRGEGTSQRVTRVGDEEREVATDQAARYAAIMAAEQITPRRVRDSIDLAEDAPAFDDGMSYVDSDQLPEARRIWEVALLSNPRSAALHFDLGAVCEAMGDFAAAEQHYAEAARLDPKDSRYRRKVRKF